MGLGIIIGTGIFVLTGIGAAKYAGPGLMLSFVSVSYTHLVRRRGENAFPDKADDEPGDGKAYPAHPQRVERYHSSKNSINLSKREFSSLKSRNDSRNQGQADSPCIDALPSAKGVVQESQDRCV